MIRKLLLRFFFALIFLLSLGSCSSRFSKLFLSPCSAPCWYNVIPGQTTKDELLQQTLFFPYYQQEDTSWVDWNNDQKRSRFNMNVNNNNADVEIELHDNVVYSISIAGTWGLSGLHDIGLNLRDTIALYGEPPKIFIGLGCGGDQVCLNLNLIYPDKGLLVAVETSDPLTDIRVLPTLPVRLIMFFNPPDIRDILERSLRLLNPDCAFEQATTPWPGYTTLHSLTYCQ